MSARAIPLLVALALTQPALAQAPIEAPVDAPIEAPPGAPIEAPARPPPAPREEAIAPGIEAPTVSEDDAPKLRRTSMWILLGMATLLALTVVWWFSRARS